MAKPERQTPYLLELDVVRVLLIVGVLYTHTETTMGNATTIGTVSRMIFSYTHLMLHFTRMGFVFITGFVLMWRYYQKSFNWFLFWGKRYLRIGIPYLVWITLYLGGLILVRQQPLVGSNYWPKWWHIVTSGNQFYLYYLFMIAQMYLIFPLIRWLFARLANWHVYLLLGSVILQLGLVAIIKYIQPTHGGHPVLGVIFWHYGTDPLMYQLYFVLGAYIALHYQQMAKKIDQYGKQLAGIAVVLSVMTIGLYWFNLHVLKLSHHQAESIHQPFMVIMDVMVILLVWWLSRCCIKWINHKQQTYLNYWVHLSGQFAFGIYLMQTIMLTILAGLLRLTNWPSWLYLILTPIAFGLVFGGTYLLVGLVDRSVLLRPVIGLQISDQKQVKSY